MMKYLQKLGKSLILPVIILIVGGILMAIGHGMDPTGAGTNVVAVFFAKAGGALIDNMGALFAIGIAVGMADDNDGAAALSGLVSWLMIITLLSAGAVAMFKGVKVDAVPEAFNHFQVKFFGLVPGLVAGLIGSSCYNKFKGTKLPDFLGFFSGKRSVAIVTAGASIVAALVLFVAWPFIYGIL